MFSKKKDELIEISKTEAQRGKNYNDKKRNDSSRPVGQQQANICEIGKSQQKNRDRRNTSNI